MSIDHLKMGLVRSGQTSIGVGNDEELTPYLWPIVKEMINTAIENGQNLVVEGCYIPFDWKKDFSEDYLAQIKYYCLIMSKEYIQNNFQDILANESVVEKRLYDGDFSPYELIEANERNLQLCQKRGLNYILIDKQYEVDIEL